MRHVKIAIKILLLLMALAGQRAAWLVMTTPHGKTDTIHVEKWEVYCLLPAIILQLAGLLGLVVLFAAIMLKFVHWLFDI